MNKTLLKFYILLIITFCIFINTLPSIFLNINNSADYIKTKIQQTLDNNKDTEIYTYKNRSNVIIMLDDGWKTQYTVGYNYMHKKMMRGSIAIIASSIGKINYLNKSNLYELYDNNWDLLNHTYSHMVLDKNTIDRQIEDIDKGGTWLEKNGFTKQANILIYPEGEYNNNTIEAMKELNYISGRTVNEGFNPKEPSNLYDVKVKNILSNTKPNDVNKWVDYTINNNLTLILLFHKLENETDESLMKYKKEDFYKIIDYLDQKRDDLNIITYSEWIQIITSNIK